MYFSLGGVIPRSYEPVSHEVRKRVAPSVVNSPVKLFPCHSCAVVAESDTIASRLYAKVDLSTVSQLSSRRPITANQTDQ
jgi:hypothetical protein